MARSTSVFAYSIASPYRAKASSGFSARISVSIAIRSMPVPWVSLPKFQYIHANDVARFHSDEYNACIRKIDQESLGLSFLHADAENRRGCMVASFPPSAWGRLAWVLLRSGS